MFQLSKDHDGIVTWTIHRTDTSMNIIDDFFIQQFDLTFSKLKDLHPFQGVIITSSKPEFVAGADLGVFLALKSVEAVEALIGRMQGIFRKLETLEVPVAAAINGVALGGGFELALSCHYRVILDAPKVLIGLPEVSLGLLPGAGGTQRLPRLIGLEKALAFLLEGLKVKPLEALKAGLVDDVASSPEELFQKARQWINAHPSKQQPWDRPNFKMPGGDLNDPSCLLFLQQAKVRYLQQIRGKYPAYQSILNCVEEGIPVSLDHGLEIERHYFSKLAQTPEAQMMIKSLFFTFGECHKGLSRPPSFTKKEFKTLGIFGTNPLATELSLLATRVGLQVTHQTSASTTLDTCDFAICFLSPEENDSFLLQVESSIPATTALGVHISSFSTEPFIEHLASLSQRPKQLVGLQFFSPIEKKPLIEIISGIRTDLQVVAHSFDFVKKMSRTPISVKTQSYISSLTSLLNDEKKLCREEGFSDEDIEEAVLALGFPQGLLNSTSPKSSPPLSFGIIQTIQERYLYRQAIETLRWLDKGLIANSRDADIAGLFGWGFPSYMGGPFSFIHYVGRETFFEKQNQLTQQYGDRFFLSENQKSKFMKQEIQNIQDIKIRFNTEREKTSDSTLTWRVLIDGVESLAEHVEIEVTSKTTKDLLFDGRVKWHLSCTGYALWEDNGRTCRIVASPKV